MSITDIDEEMEAVQEWKQYKFGSSARLEPVQNVIAFSHWDLRVILGKSIIIWLKFLLVCVTS